MIYLYIILSVIACFCITKLATFIGARVKSDFVHILLILFIVICGTFYYRMAIYGTEGPIAIPDSPLLRISSLLFMLFIAIIPINAFRKALDKTK